MPFIGMRTSWLVTARNCDFATLPRSTNARFFELARLMMQRVVLVLKRRHRKRPVNPS